MIPEKPLNLIIRKMLSKRECFWWNFKEIDVFDYVKDRGNRGVYVLFNSNMRLEADYDPETHELQYGPWYYQKTYISFDDMIKMVENTGFHEARDLKLMKIKIMSEWAPDTK